jgi:hypothetical protein
LTLAYQNDLKILKIYYFEAKKKILKFKSFLKAFLKRKNKSLSNLKYNQVFSKIDK